MPSKAPVPPTSLDEEESLATALHQRQDPRVTRPGKTPAAAAEPSTNHVVPATFASAGLANATSAAITNVRAGAAVCGPC